jgi:LysR family glycine cleavage system transcriptional activator
VALFHRQHNRLSLTTAGNRLLRSVQSAFAELTDGLAYLDPESMSGELVVASTSTIAMGWLMEVLGGFHQRFPEITLRLITLTPRQQTLPAEFDVAVCLGEPVETLRMVTPLYQESYIPVCSPKLVRADTPVQNAEDLLAYPLIHDRISQWQRWFQLNHLQPDRNQQNLYMDYGFQAIHAAKLGLGIVLADGSEVGKDLREGRLITLLEPPMAVQQSVHLVHHHPDQLTLPARLLAEAIVEYKRG